MLKEDVLLFRHSHSLSPCIENILKVSPHPVCPQVLIPSLDRKMMSICQSLIALPCGPHFLGCSVFLHGPDNSSHARGNI